MKKIISIILMCSMLASFIACSSDTENTPTDTTGSQVSDNATNAVTNAVEPISEELEALDYGGEKVVILSRSNHYQPTEELFAEDLNSDPINDAIYNRNCAVSELLGVELVEEKGEAWMGIQEKVGIMVNAGDTTYDIVAGSAAWAPPMILNGYIYNLNDNGIENYLDTSKPWWPQYWIQEAEIDGKLYCLAGGPGFSLYRFMNVVYYNKDLGDKYGIEDLYDVVSDGRWTIDYVSSIVSSIYRDLNGNDLRDSEDEYGVIIDDYDNTDAFWSSCNMKLISKNADGEIEFDATSKEKILTTFEKLYKLIFDNNGSRYYRGGIEDPQKVLNFSGGRIMLSFMELKDSETLEFRNMQDEYGILPTPKYDENQKDYYTYVHDQYSMFLIPKTVKDPEMSGAVLEAMAYESYKTLMPAYFEVTLKGRYANDPESREMLDMISNNVMMDTAIIYGGWLSYPAAYIIRGEMNFGNTSCVTVYEGYARKMNKVISAIRSELAKMDY